MRIFLMTAVAALGLLSGPAMAQTAGTALPVDRVVLSTAGLAHIEHALTVEGAEDVRLPLRLDQVDDVMKSLIVFDAKGSLGGVTLPGRQSLAEAFRDLPFQQHQLDDPVLLLNAYQGAAVTAVIEGGNIKGQLVRVTAEPQVTPEGLQENRYRLTLMTAEGLRRIWLDAAQSLQFDDPSVKDEITRALKAVRAHATSSQRELKLRLEGEGRRSVRLAYVVDAPLWKAAYRMVLPATENDAEGFMQGWAVIENMTASNWTDVDLTLVSGNPVTFRQQLYQSYYVDRPEVPVEVLGRVMPRVDEGAVGTADLVEKPVSRAARPQQKAFAPAPAAAPMMLESMAMDSAAFADAAGDTFAGGMGNVAKAAQAAASTDAATQVLFHFPSRVSLAAGETLMVPFVSQDMAMRRLSVYQPDTHPRHPLAAVEIENKGKSGLPPGVLTLYEENAALKGSAYVGDARLPALGAGEKRLVSYALDSKVTVDRQQSSDSRRGQVSFAGGVLRAEQLIEEKTAYTIKAVAGEPRSIVIEHPRRGDFKLISPDAKDAEVTDQYYRFRVDIPEDGAAKLDVVLARVEWQTYGIADISTEQLLAFADGASGVDKDTRSLFADLAKTRRAIDDADAKLAQLEQERAAIFSDQERLRANLANLSRSGTQSDLQKRYLKTLEEQESRLADIEEERARLVSRRAGLLDELKNKMTAAD